jgi:hypothetical protein
MTGATPEKQTPDEPNKIPGTPESGEPKPNGSGEPKAKKAKKAKIKEQPAGPLPDEAQKAPDAPQMAQQDAAEAFMRATSQSQAFTPATQSLLGSVKMGLPDRDVYFRVKPIEEVKLPDGKIIYKNVAVVWLFSLSRGARMSMNEPTQWVVDVALVPAFQQKKARIEPHHLRLGVDRQGTPTMIAVPTDRGWSADGTRKVILEAETRWVKQWWDAQKGRQWEPGDDQALVPTWPVESFEVLYMLAVGPIYINDKTHDIYKRICGA